MGTPRITTVPFAWTQDPGVNLNMAAPADIHYVGSASAALGLKWVRTLGFDQKQVSNSPSDPRVPGWDDGSGVSPTYFGFNRADAIFVEAVRLESPFADGLVCTQPTIPVYLKFTDIRYDVVPGLGTYGLSATLGPYLRLDLHGPFNEWQDVNQYLPLTSVELLGPEYAATQTGRAPELLVSTEDLVLKTIGVDPAYNGLPAKIEVNVKVRHAYPRVTS